MMAEVIGLERVMGGLPVPALDQNCVVRKLDVLQVDHAAVGYDWHPESSNRGAGSSTKMDSMVVSKMRASPRPCLLLGGIYERDNNENHSK